MDLKLFLINNNIIQEGMSVDFWVHPKYLWMGLGVMLVLFATISFVLVYHWTTYGYKPLTTSFMGAIFFSISLIFFSIILITLLGYSTTT